MSAVWAWFRRFGWRCLAYAGVLAAFRAWLALIAGTGIVPAYRTEGISVPLGIFEVLVCSYKIIDGKEILVIEQTRTTPDDLLKLHHIIDRAQEDDVPHVLGIDAGG